MQILALEGKISLYYRPLRLPYDYQTFRPSGRFDPPFPRRFYLLLTGRFDPIWKHRRRSNTSNSETHSHSTKVFVDASTL